LLLLSLLLRKSEQKHEVATLVPKEAHFGSKGSQGGGVNSRRELPFADPEQSSGSAKGYRNGVPGTLTKSKILCAKVRNTFRMLLLC
jgi:hypothetical protein